MGKTTKFMVLILFLCSIPIFIFSLTAPLEPFSLGDIEAVISNYYNNIKNPTILSLRYNQKVNEKNRITEIIEIYFNDYLNRTCITLNAKDRKKILKLLGKILDNVKSQKEKVDVKIGDLNTSISWKKGNQEWIEVENNKMFFNVKTGIDKTHEMVISFSEATTENGKYKPGVLFLKEESVVKLINALSDNNYKSLLKNAKPK
jgi:hypothetical protein